MQKFVIVSALAGLTVLRSGCSTTSPVQDGEVVGSLVTVADDYVCTFLLPTGSGQGILFDTGGDPAGTNVLAGLQARGISASGISDVFISHGHGDHTGGMLLFPNARTWAFEADAALIAAEGPAGATITDGLQDGMMLPLGNGISVEVLASPGHTPGNTAFLVDGVLVMGDTAVAYTDGTIAPPPDNFSEDPEQATLALSQLAQRLEPRATEINAMVFAHTGSLVTVDALMQWL